MRSPRRRTDDPDAPLVGSLVVHRGRTSREALGVGIVLEVCTTDNIPTASIARVMWAGTGRATFSYLSHIEAIA